MNVVNVLMDKYRTTLSCSLLQNGRVYSTTTKNNATASNLACESITYVTFDAYNSSRHIVVSVRHSGPL